MQYLELINKLNLIDCMEGMKLFPDKFFELAIVDPPYGIGKRLSQGAGKLKNRCLQTMNSEWDISPSLEYFNELFRISKNQIIWGGNYFDLPPTRGIICWDKEQPWENFSQFELAWSSFDCPSKIFRLRAVDTDDIKIHPTQKSIKLYRWLLEKYAKQGDKILDTHVGGASSIIAFIEKEYEFCGFEINEEYYNSAQKRIFQFKNKDKMSFDKNMNPILEKKKLF